jgi:hypothetical protein
MTRLSVAVFEFRWIDLHRRQDWAQDLDHLDLLADGVSTGEKNFYIPSLAAGWNAGLGLRSGDG